MLHQIISLIREHADETIINNPDVPNEHNEAVVAEAGNSITGTLQSMLAGGQAKDVLSLFNTTPENLNSNPAVQQVSGNFMSGIMEKFGISSSQAMSIASGLMPMVLGKLVSRTNNPADNGFQIQDIFNQLSNNKTSGINISGLLTKFGGSGMDKDGDGDVDLNDLTAAFGGSGTSGQDGGLMDTITGMLKGK
jgi:hypothetical protein